MRCEIRLDRRKAGKKLIEPEEALQRRDQLRSGAGFTDKTVRAEQPDRGLGFWRAILHGEEQNFGRGGDAAYLKGGGDAIHHRHIDIQQHQFGVEGLYLIDSLLAIRGFTADGERMGVQQIAHGMASNVMIVDQQNSRRKSPVRLLTCRTSSAIVLPMEGQVPYRDVCMMFKTVQTDYGRGCISFHDRMK